jgi:hypothetical protein
MKTPNTATTTTTLNTVAAAVARLQSLLARASSEGREFNRDEVGEVEYLTTCIRIAAERHTRRFNRALQREAKVLSGRQWKLVGEADWLPGGRCAVCGSGVRHPILPVPPVGTIVLNLEDNSVLEVEDMSSHAWCKHHVRKTALLRLAPEGAVPSVQKHCERVPLFWEQMSKEYLAKWLEQYGSR